MLKLGSQGPEVTQLQGRLRSYSPGLAVDGRFGPRTEHAVRHFQRLKGLYPPDGIVGSITDHALTAAGTPPTTPRPHPGPPKPAPKPPPGEGDPGPLKPAVDAARRRARGGATPPGDVAEAAALTTSLLGRRFIFTHEAQRGVSNHLHHPTAGSGVTIGPGYDMKDRSPAEISRDLQFINVTPAAAEQAAHGAHLVGKPAGAFVKAHQALLDLSEAQQDALLRRIVPHYEQMVRKAIKIPLHQYEFDALVSYAYNPGGGWTKATTLVNEHKPHDAMAEISRHVFSKGEKVHSLVVRRAAECRMFLYGEYT